MRRPAIAFAPRASISAGICLGLSIILSSWHFTSVGHWNEDSYVAQSYATGAPFTSAFIWTKAYRKNEP